MLVSSSSALLFVCVLSVLLQMEILLWSELFWFSLLPTSLHPIRSQITDLVRFLS